VAKPGASLEELFEEEAGVAGGRVFEVAEDGVAEALVEAACLEVEGVEVGAAAAAAESFVFGLAHELGAEAGAAEGFGDEEHIDVQITVAGGAEKAAENFAGGGIGEGDAERAGVEDVPGLGVVEGAEESVERLRVTV